MYKYLLLLNAVLFASCASSAPKEFMIADLDPLEAGTIDAGVQAYFPSRIKPISIPLRFDPRTDRVWLEFPYETVTYRQYWDGPGREQLIGAVKKYLADYASQNLASRSRSRTRDAYGKFRSLTEWGTFKIMINSMSRPWINLGYTFYKDSPYFLITQRSAPNISPVAGSRPNDSLQIEFFLTKAMAEQLAAAFERSRLLALLPAEVLEESPPPGESLPPPADTVPPDVYGGGPR